MPELLGTLELLELLELLEFLEELEPAKLELAEEPELEPDDELLLDEVLELE